MKEGRWLERGDKCRPVVTRNQGRTVRPCMPEPTGWSTQIPFVASEAVCILKLTGRSSLRLFLASGRREARLDGRVRVMTLQTRVSWYMISQHLSSRGPGI
jgi:hypothetical protein